MPGAGSLGPRGLTAAFRDKYELVAELGKGGMGEVYRGLDRGLDRPVAIKFLLSADAESRARFAREARTLARVHHANVTIVFEVGDDDGVPFLVSELVTGEALSAYLARAGRLPEADVARLGAGVARGLAAVHAIGVIHRDLKPANVLLTPEGLPKICDFGLARSAHDDAVTRSGTITGTPEYLAPELLHDAAAGPACDTYALGCMLYEMLAGSVPFPMRVDGVTRPLLDVLNAHARQPPPPLTPAPSAEMLSLVLACLAKVPAERPTAAEAAARLEAFAPRAGVARTGRATGRARVASAPARTQLPVTPPRGSGAAVIALAACVTMAVLGTGAWLTMRHSKPQIVTSTPNAPEPTTPMSAAPGDVTAIDASDPASALPRLLHRLGIDPRRLAPGDAAVARGLPRAILDSIRARVAALDDRPDQPLPLKADVAPLALMLARGLKDTELALAAVARLLAGPPRPDEALLLELVARHAENGSERLAALLLAAKLPAEVAHLLPASRVLAMKAHGELAAGRRDAAAAIVTEALQRYPRSVLLAELTLLVGGTLAHHNRWIWDMGGAEMEYVPPGSFAMGEDSTAQKYADSRPRHQVWLSGYFIDRYETSIEAYRPFHEWVHRTRDHRRCGDSPCRALDHPMGEDVAGSVTLRPDGIGLAPDSTFADADQQFDRGRNPELPVSGVNWFDSDAFARWTGRALPTEAQWERAARGTDGRRYPWGGETPVAHQHANFAAEERELDPVGMHEKGASPCGCFNMAGNVEEWCRDWYDEDGYATHVGAGAVDPTGPAKGTERVRRGGQSTDSMSSLVVYDRSHSAPGRAQYRGWGFRTVYAMTAAAPVTRPR